MRQLGGVEASPLAGRRHAGHDERPAAAQAGHALVDGGGGCGGDHDGVRTIAVGELAHQAGRLGAGDQRLRRAEGTGR